MLKIWYKQRKGDYPWFAKHKEGRLTEWLFYVDDKFITRDNVTEIRNFKKKLGKEYETKDVGTLQYSLGLKLAYPKQGIIHLSKHILDLLKENGKLRCQPLKIPNE